MAPSRCANHNAATSPNSAPRRCRVPSTSRCQDRCSTDHNETAPSPTNSLTTSTTRNHSTPSVPRGGTASTSNPPPPPTAATPIRTTAPGTTCHKESMGRRTAAPTAAPPPAVAPSGPPPGASHRQAEVADYPRRPSRQAVARRSPPHAPGPRRERGRGCLGMRPTPRPSPEARSRVASSPQSRHRKPRCREGR